MGKLCAAASDVVPNFLGGKPTESSSPMATKPCMFARFRLGCVSEVRSQVLFRRILKAETQGLATLWFTHGVERRAHYSEVSRPGA